MEDLEFSAMSRGNGNDAALHNLLSDFQTRQWAKVELQVLDWTHGRSELVKVALYHHGPDISEIGTTWISDLAAMNALRPFSTAEVEQLGGPQAFLPNAWKSTQVANVPEVYSIPWLAETLILFYRRDLLERAGIDETQAFQTPDQFFETVQRLQEQGYRLPVALPPRSNRILLLHTASTWLWQAGGEFMAPDGREVLFHQPPALNGLIGFFRLLRSISPEGVHLLDQYDIVNSFRDGLAPLAIGGAWLHPAHIHMPITDAQWGASRLPGPPFVGGSNLVIWKHTRQETAALSLIQFLIEEKAAAQYAGEIGILSARAVQGDGEPYRDDPFRRTFYESIQSGKTFPIQSLWGLVEDRLATTLAGIWDRLYDNPELPLDETVTQALAQLARSLNLTLSQR